MQRDATALCGSRHERGGDRHGYRWGHATGKLGVHGGKIAIDRPRVRARSGSELALQSWEAAQTEAWLGCWAMNPDADQRLDASLRARGAPAGRRHLRPCRRGRGGAWAERPSGPEFSRPGHIGRNVWNGATCSQSHCLPCQRATAFGIGDLRIL